MWSLVTPWLCRPVNPFVSISDDELLAEREDDKRKFMAMSLFWLKSDEVAEILRKECSTLHDVYRSNIVEIDLDYDVTQPKPAQPVPPIRAKSTLPLKVRVKLGLPSPSAWSPVSPPKNGSL